MDSRTWVKDRTILRVVAGSHAYGTNVEGSDDDFKGVAVAPAEFYLGFSLNFEQQEQYKNKGAESDETIYELRKFMHLCSQGNPNCLENLFVEPADILEIKPAGQKLVDNRDLFLTKVVKHRFSGYMMAQINRIKSHKRHLLSPPKAPPNRSDYGLSTERKLSKDDFGAVESLTEKGHSFSGELMELIQQERAYKSAQKEWDSFVRWKETRNPDRSRLEEKYLYDTKHAMHVVRLGIQCEEILSGKGLIVKRPDKDFLLSIRNGAWSYDELLDWATKQDEKCQNLYEISALPHGPDLKKLDLICEEIIRSMI